MAEWWEEETFTEAGHQTATAERLTLEELNWRRRIAQGMRSRAEKHGFWRSRSLAVAWLETLEAEGDDSRWIHENRQTVFAGLEEEGWFEPSLSGEELAKAVDSVFGANRRERRSS